MQSYLKFNLDLIGPSAQWITVYHHLLLIFDETGVAVDKLYGIYSLWSMIVDKFDPIFFRDVEL